MGPAAVKQIRRLDAEERRQIEDALRRVAKESGGGSGYRGGKSLKVIRGRREKFFRLRVGNLRVIFDLLNEDRVLHVMAVLNRRDLDRWLRQR